ncbi:MAG: YicC/YloC family endoribonuclease [Thermodesulfobacteriota bacterium]
MTGYGTAAVPVTSGRLVAEVRSVNSRFLELRISLPREHQAIETELRETVQKSIERGRVDVVVRREGAARPAQRIEPDLELARATVAAWRRVKKELKLPGDVDLSLLCASAGELLRPVQSQPDVAKELPALRRVVGQALRQHTREREREGASLLRDMRQRWRNLGALHRQCSRLARAMKPLLTERLTARVKALLGEQGVDDARVLQEVALAVDRSEVSEELTRLGSHLDALAGLLRDEAAVGKRVEFLIQEMVREVNTIGSKANHLPMTQAVLAAKSELEKLREQAANVE